MIKQAPKPLQIVAMVTFVMACVGVLLYLWLSFGGVIPLRSEGYRIQVQFPEAVQLAEQSDVRISGVPVGKVVKIEPGPENTTEATLEMRSRYAPVPKNAIFRSLASMIPPAMLAAIPTASAIVSGPPPRRVAAVAAAASVPQIEVACWPCSKNTELPASRS